MWIKMMILCSMIVTSALLYGAIVDHKRNHHQRTFLHLYILFVFLGEVTAGVANLLGKHNTVIYNIHSPLMDTLLFWYINNVGKRLYANSTIGLLTVVFLILTITNDFIFQDHDPLKNNPLWLGSFLVILIIYLKFLRMLHYPRDYMNITDQKIISTLLFYFMVTFVHDLLYQYIRSSGSDRWAMYLLYGTKYTVSLVSYCFLGWTLLQNKNHAKS